MQRIALRPAPPVRALILAAGRGERLRPLTDDRPKCLVALAGRLLLDWQLDALREAGIHDIAVVVGWQGARVRRPGLARFENPKWECTSMVASLLAAASWLRAAPCIVAYGDIVYRPEIVRSLASSRHDIAIAYDLEWRALWETRFEQPERDAETLVVERGIVRDIGGPVHDLDRVGGQYIGMLRVTSAGLERIRGLWEGLTANARRSFDMTRVLAQLVAAGIPIGAVPTRGGWCEVDQRNDIRVYEEKLHGDDGWRHDWRSPAR